MRLSSAESVVNSFTCLSFRVGSSRLCYQLWRSTLPYLLVWQPAASFSRLGPFGFCARGPNEHAREASVPCPFRPYPQPPKFPSSAILPFQEQGEHSNLNIIKFRDRG